MATVLLVIHFMIAAALVGVVLLQRSEGGGLGMGGGGGGFMTGRGTANLLTRTTAFLAAGFFATSLLLAILARQSAPVGSIVDGIGKPSGTSTSEPVAPAGSTGGTTGGSTQPLPPVAPLEPTAPQSQ
jgi:preprotein translocase subunit SecG